MGGTEATDGVPAHGAELGAAAALRPESFPKERILPETRLRYGRQNLAVLTAQVFGWLALLTAIDATSSWLLKVPLVLLFCAMMQGVFSLMHEYFHAIAHPDRRVGYAMGLVASTLFGTSATLHRVNHWGHHVRNRTAAERGEFIHEGESALAKTLLYYFAVLFGLWLSGLVIPFLVLFVPYRSVTWLASHGRFNTYAAAFGQFKPAQWHRMRLEALGLGLFWGSVIALGPWRPETLALAYGSFACTWSSLQWVYHLWTPLDVVEGAYNLRLPTPLRWLFLNFNMNLTHHRRPHLPWQRLYAASDPKETQPLFHRWVRLLTRPPVPFPEDLSALEKRYF